MLDAVLAIVIDELSLMIGLISPCGFKNLFPVLKYIMSTSILENTQAIESENVAITPFSTDSGIINIIIKLTIRINCSKNSEKLIAKNLFSPQRAPRRIE